MEPVLRFVADAALGRPETYVRVSAIQAIWPASLVAFGMAIPINAVERAWLIANVAKTNVPNV